MRNQLGDKLQDKLGGKLGDKMGDKLGDKLQDRWEPSWETSWEAREQGLAKTDTLSNNGKQEGRQWETTGDKGEQRKQEGRQ